MDIIAITKYLDKLEKIITYEAEFSFANYKLIKKTKIDDTLCCLLASFPDTFKKFIQHPHSNKYQSVLSYNLLFRAIKGKFILNSNVYLVNTEKVTEYIKTIKIDIEKDVERIEKIEVL